MKSFQTVNPNGVAIVDHDCRDANRGPTSFLAYQRKSGWKLQRAGGCGAASENVYAVQVPYVLGEDRDCKLFAINNFMVGAAGFEPATSTV